VSNFASLIFRTQIVQKTHMLRCHSSIPQNFEKTLILQEPFPTSSA